MKSITTEIELFSVDDMLPFSTFDVEVLGLGKCIAERIQGRDGIAWAWCDIFMRWKGWCKDYKLWAFWPEEDE